MNFIKQIYFATAITTGICINAQQNSASEKQNPIIQNIINEANSNSQLEPMAFELLDLIGPRLVGSPEMKASNDWAVEKFKTWGISAQNEEFGEWNSWQRGITQVEMTSPRIKSIEATQLAWSPATKKPVEAEVIFLPNLKSKTEFEAWLKTIKGKFVLISQYQKIGRPEHQIKEFATTENFQKYKDDKQKESDDFKALLKNIDQDNSTLPIALEDAGASGIAISNWTGIMGANRVFGAKTKKIPTIDISLEDYGLLYRLALNGKKPTIKVNTQSKNLGRAKSFNTIAKIEGKEKPNEYVILSAHLDSWDGAQGATDNATGVITMMEAARILKKYYPNNKRTILIGLWGSEEQGLNGSSAFVADNPNIVKNTQVVFNSDSGTGRTNFINGQGFLNSYDFLGKWISMLPKKSTNKIDTDFPGMPSGGGSDHAAFTSVGIPAFYLGGVNWGYSGYTWHTNKDTYDKIMFDEIQNNVIVAALLAYFASEEENLVDRTHRVLPNDEKWPEQRKPKRTETE